MTTDELADIAAREVCERVARALGDILDACAGDEIPLTPEQRTYVGTGLLREMIGLNADLARMFSNAVLLDEWRDQGDDESLLFSDERLAAWLDGELQ